MSAPGPVLDAPVSATPSEWFDRGKRQGLANAQAIVELAVRDGRDPIKAIRAALVAAIPNPPVSDTRTPGLP